MDNPQPVICFNNAATTWPKPPGVPAEAGACLQVPVHEAGRTTGTGSTEYPPETREVPAAFFHAGPPGHFVFPANATDSLNLLIHGFAKKTGTPFHVVTTEPEHNAVLRPLNALVQEKAISLPVVPFTGNTVDLAAIKTAITPKTRLVVMNHGSNVSGLVQDIRPIAEYFSANEIFFIVDGDSA